MANHGAPVECQGASSHIERWRASEAATASSQQEQPQHEANRADQRAQMGRKLATQTKVTKDQTAIATSLMVL
jgi:hypothetical protein